jgi:hypothetical protein
MIDFRRLDWAPDFTRRLAKEMGLKNLNLPQVVIVEEEKIAKLFYF